MITPHCFNAKAHFVFCSLAAPSKVAMLFFLIGKVNPKSTRGIMAGSVICTGVSSITWDCSVKESPNTAPPCGMAGIQNGWNETGTWDMHAKHVISL